METLTPEQLRRKIERERRARRLDFMQQRRPDSMRTSFLRLAVAFDKNVAAMEETVRPAVSATITKSNSVSRTPALRGYSADFVIMDETRDWRATS